MIVKMCTQKQRGASTQAIVEDYRLIPDCEKCYDCVCIEFNAQPCVNYLSTRNILIKKFIHNSNTHSIFHNNIIAQFGCF